MIEGLGYDLGELTQIVFLDPDPGTKDRKSVV